MAKITRYNGNLKAFASEQLTNERTVFGDTAIANDLTSQFTPEFLRGWGIVGASDQPSLQDFNAAMYTNGQLIAYLHQMGVAEYNAAQEYHSGSLTQAGGILYISLANTNIGNTPSSSPLSWKALNYEQATTAILGLVKLATQAQVTAGTDNATAVTPLTLAQRLSAVIVNATQSVVGVLRFATQTEVNNSAANNVAVSPATLGVLLTNYIVQATTTVAGILRTATQALVNAGTDTQTAVTPATLRFGVAYSLTINGYIVLPSWLGGIALQWGSVAAAGTVTFPTAFTAAYIAIASSNINGNFTSTSALTTTSVLLSNSGNQPMTWLSLGRV